MDNVLIIRGCDLVQKAKDFVTGLSKNRPARCEVLQNRGSSVLIKAMVIRMPLPVQGHYSREIDLLTLQRRSGLPQHDSSNDR